MLYRVVDTNIVSFMVKLHPLRFKYFHHLLDCELLISFQTEGEILEGAFSAKWGSCSTCPS